MQKLIVFVLLAVSLTLNSQISEEYPVDVTKSVINWKGTYTFDIGEHKGEVYLKKGVMYSSSGTLTGGNFVIDMTSITNDDYKLKRGPVEHLKDPDFFDIEKYPEATLEITSIEYFPETNTHEVFANLTIKGVTKDIKFYPVIDGVKKTLESRFKIDRVRWGITYNNKLRNHAISEAIEFNVFLQFE